MENQGNILLISIFFVYLTCVSGSFNRTVKTDILTYVDINSTINLAHTKAVGKNDTLHYLFGVLGTPCSFVARTNTESELFVDWGKLVNTSEIQNSIHFTSPAFYSYAVLFPRIYEYNDTNDEADLDKVSSDNQTSWTVHTLHDLTWDDISTSSNTSANFINLTFSRNQNSFEFLDNGFVSLQFTVFSSDERAEELPHLELTANTTQVDFTMHNVSTNYTNARFALEMIVVTSDDKADEMSLTSQLLIDDEYAPGVFDILNLLSQYKDDGSDSQSTGAYLQWKPVCYRKVERKRNVATKAKNYDLVNFNSSNEQFVHDLEMPSIALAYFGDTLTSGGVVVKATNVSFGLSKDKFYTSTNVTSWTFNLGYGVPPADKVSLMVIFVISIGLGIPVLVILFGGISVCVKKHKERKSALSEGYTQIQ